MHRAFHHLKAHWHYSAILGFTLLFYFPLLAPGIGLPAGGDFFAYHTPFRLLTAQRLQAAEFPFHTNDIYGGYPLFADPQFAVLYPVNFLFALIAPVPNTGPLLDFYMLVNLVLFSLGLVYFARSFRLAPLPAVVMAVVAGFNSFIEIHITHINMIQVLTTSLMAAGFLVRYAREGARDHRWVAGAAIMLASGNLAGHPQTTLYTHYTLVVICAALAMGLWRRQYRGRAAIRLMLMTGVACLLGILLAAVQLVPTAHLLGISTRALVERHSVEWSPLNFHLLPSVLFPGFYMRLPGQLAWPFWHQILDHGEPIKVTTWTTGFLSEFQAAMGVSAFVLGLIGWFRYWRRWEVQLLGLGSLFLLGCATGESLPLYGWLYDYLPGVSLVRVSTRILILFFPAWGMMAALGVTALMNESPRRIRQLGGAALGVLGAVIGTAAIWIFMNRQSSALETWLLVFAEKVRDTAGLIEMRRHGDEINRYLLRQLYLGIFVIAALSGALLSRKIGRGWRMAIFLLIMALELSIYSFGWGMNLHLPTIKTTDSEELLQVTKPAVGRTVTINGTNPAMHMGIPVANGYSVSLDNWITLMQPDTFPPWRGSKAARIFDLWNVSDVVLPARPMPLEIEGTTLTLSDWGWTEVGSPRPPDATDDPQGDRAHMLTGFDMGLTTTQPVSAVYVLGFAEWAEFFKDGTEISRVVIRQEGTTEPVSAPVLLGTHLSDPRYPLPGQPIDFYQHSRAKMAYYRGIGYHWTSNVQMFMAALDVQTSGPIASLVVEGAGPYASMMGFSYVIVRLADGSYVARAPLGVGDLREIPSASPYFHVMHREAVPGYVHMVPVAETMNSTSSTEIVKRVLCGADGWTTVILTAEKSGKLPDVSLANATDPVRYEGHARIKWRTPEKATIHTNSNQRGWLYLSYSYDAGWSVKLDGESVPLLRANGAFMAIPVPEGNHKVELRYRPVGFLPGLVISLTALAATAFLWRRPKLHP